MLTSNLWAYFGIQNGAKGTVIFVYKNAECPRSGKLTEAVVVQFCELDSEFMTFIPGLLLTFAIKVHSVEWKRGNNATFIWHQIPLILS